MTELSGQGSASILVGGDTPSGSSATLGLGLRDTEPRPDVFLETMVAGTLRPAPLSSGPPAAPWLADIQRRLRNSIGLPEDVGKGDGRWLGRDVYLAANSFFQITSDLLPAEPHLSSSAEGDLVAEFASSVGRMTLIVTRDSAFAFAVVGGKPLQSVLGLTPIEPAKLRAELGRVTDALRAASHGALEPGR